MKKVIIIMALAFCFAGLSETNAQKENFERNASERLEKMKEELSLTDNQMELMTTLHDQFRTEIQEMRQDESLTREEFHETLLQKRETHHVQIRNILNEEQKIKFDELNKNRGNRQMANRDKKGEHPFLTDDQLIELTQKRIEFEEELSADEKEIIAAFRLEREEWQNENQTECVRDGFRPHHGQQGLSQHRQEMKPIFEIVKNHNESLMAILEEYRPEKPEDCPNDHPQRNKQRRADFGEGPGFMAMFFLMMDTQPIDMGKVDEPYIDVSIFPNPTKNFITISYELEAGSNVSIELLSKYGNVLEIIEQSYQEIGENSVKYNSSMLTPGEMYFIKVSTDETVHVDKFIKM